ncbi:MAG TPA: phenylalanine--tRNA ligase subunit beta [Candidatus Dormibacteraeota bacterium]|nr:phenylalanine--tRNA ligase subunit beta [Candidatus Dormibacteraeota bacterium]
MKVVYNWLKEFVPVTASPEELASRLALAGTNIGGIEKGAHGAIIDAEVTSNRPDCLSHLGIAREVGAIYKLPLKFVAPKLATASAAKTSEAIKVAIRSPELCARYTARVIRGVKIQPSPQWLKDRLEASGIASINNVVDATNYVMLELGNPLHAFDYDKIRDHSIVVRPANPGEKMRTLDGTERTLDPNMCIVCDGDGSRAIGSGVMGGAETEISFSTKNVLLECAWFDPISIRRAARSLKLHTEASTRFGRGVDPEMAEVASRRCAEIILQTAGGELLSGVVDIFPGKRAPKKILLTRAEILRVMGADVPDKDLENILSALGFSPLRVDANRGAEGSILAAWECTQPSWRADVEREIDLIEEVARIFGLDKFPPRLPASRQGAARLPHYEAETRLREKLIGLGYREIVTIPHVAEERNDLFRPQNSTPARLANPLSEEAGVLKSTGYVTMVAALEWNLNHGQRNARLFEIGHHYRLREGKPVETRILTLGATGESREKSIYDAARDFSFADLKGELDAAGELAGKFRWEQGGPEFLHAARRGKLFLGEGEIGAAGQLAKRVADKLKLRQDIFLAELELGPVYCSYYGVKNSRHYEPLPRFPAVERDFSLLLADGTPFADVTRTIQSLGIAEIISIEAADLFRGKNVPAGKYSLLVRVTFQSRETTLTDSQIAEFSSKIIAALEKQLGAQLRAS